MAVTQKDIAAHLNLSSQQVGFALRGEGRVAAETRERVLQAARDLGYSHQSNNAARELIAQRYGRRASTGTLGFVSASNGALNSEALPYWSRVMQGVQRGAHAQGLEVLSLHHTPTPGWQRVDGVIGLGDKPSNWENSAAAHVPYLPLFWAPPGQSVIRTNDYDGIRQATEHLIDQGHRRIGYLVFETPSIACRVDAFRHTLSAAGIEPNADWLRELKNVGRMEDRGFLTMQDWLEQDFRGTGITALLVQNDRAAMGAMRALAAAGLGVPRDISVVGFDSTDECDLCEPRLTSVKVPLEEVGRQAVELLVRIIQEQDDVKEVLLPVALELRASTGPPLR